MARRDYNEKTRQAAGSSRGETSGPAARYVPAGAPVAHVADAIAELLTNAPRRRELLQHATAVLARFDWDLAAADTLKVLEEAALGR